MVACPTAGGVWRKQFMWRGGDDVRLQPAKTRFGTRGGSVITTNDQRHNQEQDRSTMLTPHLLGLGLARATTQSPLAHSFVPSC